MVHASKKFAQDGIVWFLDPDPSDLFADNVTRTNARQKEIVYLDSPFRLDVPSTEIVRCNFDESLFLIFDFARTALSAHGRRHGVTLACFEITS